MRRFNWRFLGFLAMLAVFVFLFIDNRELSNEVKQTTVEIRQSQVDGCMRTNERNRNINKEFNDIYRVALTMTEELGGNAEVLKRYVDEFGNLPYMDCNKVYPNLQTER